MKRFTLLAVILGLSGVCHAGVPLTDLVLYGRVYAKTTHAPIVGTLPGPITVKVNNDTGPTNTVICATGTLLDPGSGTAQYYILRIRRFESGTLRNGSNDVFAMPGDRLHICLNGVEVDETQNTSVLVTDALGDIRLLSLNAPANPDADGDGLPDDWEQRYFGGLARGPNDSPAGDGVSLRVAYALGLDPRFDNRSRLPFLQLEQGTNLVYYFRQSAEATGLTNTVQCAEALTSANWVNLAGAVPQRMGVEGNSLILKVVVPGGIDRPQRFLRLISQ